MPLLNVDAPWSGPLNRYISVIFGFSTRGSNAMTKVWLAQFPLMLAGDEVAALLSRGAA
jgi:hypothetical protein